VPAVWTWESLKFNRMLRNRRALRSSCASGFEPPQGGDEPRGELGQTGGKIGSRDCRRSLRRLDEPPEFLLLCRSAE
jgi:hypothetical protein